MTKQPKPHPRISMNTWHHPELGKFALDITGWTTKVSVPAFNVFKFDRPSRTKLTLGFEAGDENEPPSKAAIAVALRLFKNQRDLAKRVTVAVWDDLNGRDPSSGMWWHGDLDSVREHIAYSFKGRKPRPLRKPQDLHALLGISSFWIREQMHYYEKPSATIMFEAAFEPEHGLGVLTNGSRVIGSGYQMSVGPFFKEQIRKR